MKKFCDLKSRNDLASYLGISKSNLAYVLYKKKVESFYTSFEIQKKGGGTRQIRAPKGSLKYIQECLANSLSQYQKSIRLEKHINSNISHAFEKGKSIITNAEIHRNKYVVLNLDLNGFFESFHFGRVMGYFEKNRDFNLPHEVAVVLAQLACFNGCLPQGSPCSPIISNLMCQILDMRILKLAKRYKLDYTRYADDLTFSTNNRSFVEHLESFQEEIEAEINRAGFTINHKKTRMFIRNFRQEVTGLVVNKKININAQYYRVTRAMANHLYTKGSFVVDGREGSIASLEGRFAFINQLDKYNNRIDGEVHDFRRLNGRELQYRKFLFYKYFYANDRPMIVTEGKTDIRYIKSALKKLYKEYPNLIEKRDDGFRFKVSFLRRTKRLQYFFGISLDGADTIKNIYYYYSDSKDKAFINYHEWFSKNSSMQSKHPVILLFDNEINNNAKPLSKFLGSTKIREDRKEELKKQLSIRLVDNSNLYLATNPLVNNMDECEIEHLFKQVTLEHQIDGRTFMLKDKYDVSKHYGKEIFSQYISQNYEQIDFSGFRGLLDTISGIVSQYTIDTICMCPPSNSCAEGL